VKRKKKLLGTRQKKERDGKGRSHEGGTLLRATFSVKVVRGSEKQKKKPGKGRETSKDQLDGGGEIGGGQG